MRMSRPVSWFLTAFGVWSWIIWITFIKNIWHGQQSVDAHGHWTAFFYVHLVLAVVSLVLGTIIGVIGWRGVRALRS